MNAFLQTNQCSIFCKLENYNVVAKYLDSTISDVVSLEKLDNDSNIGEKFRITHSQEYIDFYVLIRKQGGDKVSKILISAFNRFRRIETDATFNKEFIQQHLSESNSSISIKSSTEYSDFSYKFILQFVNELEGLIFTGSSMLDDMGALVLGDDGAYSVLYEYNKT